MRPAIPPFPHQTRKGWGTPSSVFTGRINEVVPKKETGMQIQQQQNERRQRSGCSPRPYRARGRFSARNPRAARGLPWAIFTAPRWGAKLRAGLWWDKHPTKNNRRSFDSPALHAANSLRGIACNSVQQETTADPSTPHPQALPQRAKIALWGPQSAPGALFAQDDRHWHAADALRPDTRMTADLGLRIADSGH
jgi:hypothetical protein